MADVFNFKISLDYVHIMLRYGAKSTAKIIWPPIFGGTVRGTGYMYVDTLLGLILLCKQSGIMF